MPNKKSIICIMPARGGSKRFPRKNIKKFLGKPLLAWTIKVAKDSGVLDRIILSTDDKEIARIGMKYGTEVPFMRPKKFAQDRSTPLSVVQHAIKWLKDKEDYGVDWVVFLEPSSPGRQTFHIQEVVRLINQKRDIDSIVGISEIPGHFSPLKALSMGESGLITRYPDGELVRNLTHRNQDLPALYFINSAIYAFKATNFFEENPSLWGNRVLGYIMDSRYAIDIDTPDDWLTAEVRMRGMLK